MRYRDSNSVTIPRARWLAFAAAALLWAPPSASWSEELCSAGVAGIATTCDAAAELAQSLARARVDRTLATDPLADRSYRLKNGAASPAGDIVPLFAMTADGDNTNFKTSLSQWGTALSIADQETLKQLQAGLGEDLALPKAVTRAPHFDIWAQGRRELVVDHGVLQANALTSYVGADYRWHNDLLIGAMVQLDDSRRSILTSPDASEGAAFVAGPYVAYRVTPNIQLDAKAAWGTGHDSAVSGANSLSLDTNRMLTEARLSGNWGWNSWQFSQGGALTYVGEAREAIAGIPAASIDVTRFSIGPELKRHFDTGNGASIEPFAFFKSSLDLADTASGVPLAQNTVGGGVMLAKPENYNIRAMADFSESNDGADPVATGKVLVTVPSRLLGF